MEIKSGNRSIAEIKSKYGLSRTIPSEVKRTIRQECGFGCVICGLGIYTYEHIDPLFNEATVHDPEKMALLCYRHQGNVTSGMSSKKKVKSARLNPFCKQKGYSNEFFEIDEEPYLKWGGLLFKGTKYPVTYDGIPVLKVLPGENPGEPFRISGLFTDSKGKVSLEIEDNEWKAKSNNWDVEVVGRSITIREGLGKIHLILKSDPSNGLIVEKINMGLGPYQFIGNSETIKILNNGIQMFEFNKCTFIGCEVGLAL